jgi:hypothetical protein
MKKRDPAPNGLEKKVCNTKEPAPKIPEKIKQQKGAEPEPPRKKGMEKQRAYPERPGPTCKNQGPDPNGLEKK